MKHHLIINANQSLLLRTCLEQCQAQGYWGADADDREEIDLLAGMLADLPATPSEEEIVHDFTA